MSTEDYFRDGGNVVSANAKERPILFSGPMVRAILDGRKTVTRRIVKPGPGYRGEYGWVMTYLGDERLWPHTYAAPQRTRAVPMRCPYGAPGDRLWVRETWAVGRAFDRTRPSEIPTVERDIPVWWRADDALEGSVNRGRWRPSLHMPRWASRITLDVVSVRVERLQEISGEDARAEGVQVPRCNCEVCVRTSAICTADQTSYIEGFRTLWDSINAKRGFGWDANPWVWRIEFRSAQ